MVIMNIIVDVILLHFLMLGAGRISREILW